MARVFSKRSRSVAPLLLAALTATTTLLADAPAELSAQLKCEGTKQVVLCVAPIVSTPGSRITYANLRVLKQPDFLRALRDTSTFSEEKGVRPKLKLVFSPSGAGAGQLVTELQAVVCKNNGQACPHFKRVLVASVRVP